LNHTLDEPRVGPEGQGGETHYQDYLLHFSRSADSDIYEAKHAAGVPGTDPGKLHRSGEMQRWVMSVFHHYQWDLKLLNPEVLIQDLDTHSVLGPIRRLSMVLRLDCGASLEAAWQANLPERNAKAHLNPAACSKGTAAMSPRAERAVMSAEAIVAAGARKSPKYLRRCDRGQDMNELAYYNAHPGWMALLWECHRHKNGQNFSARASRACQGKLDRATWLETTSRLPTDDIGFGLNDDQDIPGVGYDTPRHRRFSHRELFHPGPGPSTARPGGWASTATMPQAIATNLRFRWLHGGPAKTALEADDPGPDPSGHRTGSACCTRDPVLAWHPLIYKRRDAIGTLQRTLTQLLPIGSQQEP